MIRIKMPNASAVAIEKLLEMGKTLPTIGRPDKADKADTAPNRSEVAEEVLAAKAENGPGKSAEAGNSGRSDTAPNRSEVAEARLADKAKDGVEMAEGADDNGRSDTAPNRSEVAEAILAAKAENGPGKSADAGNNGRSDTAPNRSEVAEARLEELEFEFKPGNPNNDGLPEQAMMGLQNMPDFANGRVKIWMPEATQDDAELIVSEMPEMNDIF